MTTAIHLYIYIYVIRPVLIYPRGRYCFCSVIKYSANDINNRVPTAVLNIASYKYIPMYKLYYVQFPSFVATNKAAVMYSCAGWSICRTGVNKTSGQDCPLLHKCSFEVPKRCLKIYCWRLNAKDYMIFYYIVNRSTNIRAIYPSTSSKALGKSNDWPNASD